MVRPTTQGDTASPVFAELIAAHFEQPSTGEERQERIYAKVCGGNIDGSIAIELRICTTISKEQLQHGEFITSRPVDMQGNIQIYEDVNNSGMHVGKMGFLYFAECSLMPEHEKQKWLANAQLFKSNLTPAAPVSMTQP